MPEFKLTFKDKQVGRRIKVRMSELSKRNRRAMLGAVRDVRDEILQRGRSDIASAGNFGSRWTQGLRGHVLEHGGDVTLDITHDVPYFMVHQEGRIIHGKPLLWIPLSFANDAQGKRARDFPHPLFRVDREGKAPLLLSAVDKQPKYSGHKSVKIPKRFHVIEIARAVAKNIKSFFLLRLSGK